MASFSFRNRIAFYYIVSTGLLVFAVFIVLYNIVKAGVYSDIEKDITTELKDLYEEIETNETGFVMTDEDEWREKEHITLGINPVFIQFTDAKGNFIDKSPNLKEKFLQPKILSPKIYFYNTKLDSVSIRQIEAPLFYKNKIVGYILVAMSLEDANTVLKNLNKIMLVSYPLILLVLYAIARFLAGRSIKPVTAIIKTSENISRDNLSARITLPENKDELHLLSETINNLLDRIENAIEREKQFTSDASHELRTPLAIIKGTLEVLVRKPRERQEYEEKIAFCIHEVDRLNHLVDQLLLLARFENQKQTVKIENVYLNSIVMDAVLRHTAKTKEQNIMMVTVMEKDYYTDTDSYLFSIIIDNIISNAVKYSAPGGNITIAVSQHATATQITISDTGMGISKDDLQRIYDRFYRSKRDNVSGIKGTGLGLSIVKRLCLLLDITIKITSTEGKGTIVTLDILKNSLPQR